VTAMIDDPDGYEGRMVDFFQGTIGKED
jgi:hypothetical protein